MAKSAAIDPYLGSQLKVGRFAWSLQTTLGRTKVMKSYDGSTADLSGVAVAVHNLNKDDEGRVLSTQYKLELYCSDGVHGSPLSFGHITQRCGRLKTGPIFGGKNFQIIHNFFSPFFIRPTQ